MLELGIDRRCVSGETLRRVRLVSVATLAWMAIAPIAAAQYLLIGLPMAAVAIGIASVGAIVNLVWLRRTRRPHRAGHIGLALAAAMLVFNTALGGGFLDPGIAWLYVLPVGAAVVLDARGAWAWLGITLLLLMGFWALEGLGVALPDRIPETLRLHQALVDHVTALLAIGAMSMSFVLAQRRSERELARANRELRTEASLVRLLMHGAVAANEALSLEEALRECVGDVCRGMGWPAGHAFVVREGHLHASSARYAEDRGLLPLLELTGRSMRAPGEGLPGQAFATRRPAYVADLRAFDGPRVPAARRAGLVTAFAVPVLVQDEVVAILEFAAREPIREPERLLEVLALLGVQLGRVAERATLQDRIRHSQKIEAVGQLAAGIAHEINNPMAYVRTNLNLLRREWRTLRADLSPETRQSVQARLSECEELIADSLDGVERAVSIVREVKEFSHTGSAGWDEVDLNGVITAALRVSTPQVGDVAVETRLSALPRVRGSERQLHQVLLNLIVNALYAVRGGGSLRILTLSQGNEVVCRVEDDGPGFAGDVQERLFEPFFTTKPVGEGTGLGLYVCYEILRNHGGRISGESPPEGGARFEIRLPAAATPAG
jgi:signal transduction histidine kinase